MPSRPFPVPLAPFILLMAGLAPHVTTGQEVADPAALQHDVATRFAAGDYAGVIGATEGIEKALRAKPKDPDFVPRMRLLAELLTRRAVAEQRLGRLDAAEAALESAGKTLADKDVQRAVAMFARTAGERAAGAIVPLELTNLELVDAQLDLVLGLIEAEPAAATQPASDAPPPVARATKPAANESPREGEVAADPAGRKAKSRGDLRQVFNALLFQSRGLRQGLDERLAQADPALRSSPAILASVSTARPTLHAARAALIMARTQSATPPPAQPLQPGGAAGAGASRGAAAPAEPAAARPTPPTGPAATQVDPVAVITEALDSAVAAMAPVLTTPDDDERPAAEAAAALALARSEAAFVRAPYLEWRARAKTLAGDTAGARADIQAALADRAAAGQRAHPDVVEALVIGGEAALAEAEQTKANGDLAGSRGAFEHAVAWLSRAREVAAACPGGFDADAPLRQRIDALLDTAVESRQNTASTVATTDAVDAAARRALQALGKRPAQAARPTAAVASP